MVWRTAELLDIVKNLLKKSLSFFSGFKNSEILYKIGY